MPQIQASSSDIRTLQRLSTKLDGTLDATLGRAVAILGEHVQSGNYTYFMQENSAWIDAEEGIRDKFGNAAPVAGIGSELTLKTAIGQAILGNRRANKSAKAFTQTVVDLVEVNISHGTRALVDGLAFATSTDPREIVRRAVATLETLDRAAAKGAVQAFRYSPSLPGGLSDPGAPPQIAPYAPNSAMQATLTEIAVGLSRAASNQTESPTSEPARSATAATSGDMARFLASIQESQAIAPDDLSL